MGSSLIPVLPESEWYPPWTWSKQIVRRRDCSACLDAVIETDWVVILHETDITCVYPDSETLRRGSNAVAVEHDGRITVTLTGVAECHSSLNNRNPAPHLPLPQHMIFWAISLLRSCAGGENWVDKVLMFTTLMLKSCKHTSGKGSSWNLALSSQLTQP